VVLAADPDLAAVTLRIPLCVRLVTARADRHVTRDLRSLAYRATAVGGFASATMSLDRPLAFDAPEIALFGRVYVYDSRHGGTMWEGLLEDPGQGVGSDGQVWSLSALGPSARASDREVPLIYKDKQLSGVTRVSGCPPFVNAQTTTGMNQDSTVDDLPRVDLGVQGGVVAAAGDTWWGMQYTRIYDAGQKLARFGSAWDAYPTDASWRFQVMAMDSRLVASTSDHARDLPFSTSGGASQPSIIVADFAAGRTVVGYRIKRLTSGATTLDNMGAAAIQPYWMATRYDRNGNELLTAADYTSPTVTADLVVADLLGRLLTTYDGPNARIDAGSYSIDQIAYPDGATPAQVLDDLMTFEPAYLWEVYESQSLVAGSRNRFAWRARPVAVRYEADVSDGYDAPGSGSEIYNRCRVRWVDEIGRSRQAIRTQTVQALTDAGLVREKVLDLGEFLGSDANAVQAGDTFLADHVSPEAGGTLTVARRILDRDTGRMVDPWEIRPGHLIRVNGLSARPDSLVATAPDGRSVFWLAATGYDTSTAAATLELDTWPRTVAQAVARLHKRLATVRRR
jgi:hypothetical protein